MAVDDLSQRQRVWLFIILTCAFMVFWALFNPFRPQPKDNQAQNNQQQQAPEKPGGAPEKKAPDPAKAPEPGKAPEKDVKPEVKPEAPAADQAKVLDDLLAKLPDEEHVLGDDASKIRVVLSGRGAAIRNVTLNGYEASDRQTGQRLPANGKGPPRFVLLTDKEDPKLSPVTPGQQFEALSYRFGLVTDDDKAPPELRALAWRKEPGATAEKAAYTAEVPAKNLRVTKTYTLAKDQYHVGLELTYAKIDPAKPAEFAYELTGPRGLPVEGLRWKQFSFRHNVFVTQDGKALTRTMEGAERFDASKEPHLFHMNAPNSERSLLYAGVMIQFFASVAVVDHTAGKEATPQIDRVYSEWVGPDSDAPDYYAKVQGRLTTRLISRPVKLKNEPETHKYLLYAGPSKVLILKFEDGVEPGLHARYSDVYQLNQLTDASDVANFFQRVGITGLLVASTNLMHHLLEYLYWGVRNYGIAIIFMTVIVRLLLFPVSRKQALNQAKMQERMKVLRPEMDKLKKQYANDKQAYGIAQLELMRKHGMNPMQGCSGCWLLFLQMPVFLGLYFALRESVHLRMSGFLWIDNLAMPDMIVYWGDNFLTNIWFHLFGGRITLFYLGPYLNVLPIISVALMYVYQKLMAPPAMDAQQEQQIKMMNYMMLVMGFAFYWVASGLCLYFIVSSAWGMVERKFTKKAKERVVADMNRRDEDENGGRGKKGGDKPKPAGGVRGKLGDFWRDLQNKADKRA